MITRIFIAIFLLQLNSLFAQQRYVDSLRKILVHQERDSNKVKTLLELANRAENYEALERTREALSISRELKVEKFVLRSIHTLANINYNMGDYTTALTLYLEEMKMIESSGNMRKMPGVYNGIGNVYSAQGQYEKALSSYMAGVEIIKTFDKPLQHVLVTFYGNIGETYFLMRDHRKSREYYNKVVELNSERSEPDAYSLGNAYVGLGNVACLEKKLDDALDLYNKSLDLFRRINLDQCIAGSYNCIAKVLALKGKSNASLEFYNKSIALSEKNNAKSVLLDAYQGLVTVYSGIGDHKNAFKALEVCFGLKDSLLNESKLKLIDEMEAKYETAKKDKELILQKAELEKQQADAREKSMQRNIFIVAFVAMALLVFAVLRSYNQKKKASAEISKQKEIIEEKQKEILDSIRYAKRIQKALITSERYVERNLDRLKKDD